ncbi:MAG: PIN domain-containing protein [Anaerolineales bacterium]|nr:MAG: PIN domain-containing protein [Anaerolineales bacterium]
MSGRYLLDTNIIIALFASDTAVKDNLAKAKVFVPAIAIGELYFGARKSGRAWSP